MKRTILLFLFAAFATQLIAQQAKIIAGPMLGYMEHRETLVWLQASCCKKMAIEYYQQGQPKQKINAVLYNPHDSICNTPWIAKFILTDLKPGTTYEYKVWLDNKEMKFGYPLRFKSKILWEHRMPAPDFSFLAGSCNYVNDSLYDRPGEPYGQGTDIFWRMAEMPADFMLWLGDNVYLREADYSSASGIRYRYMHTRSDKNLQKLLAVKNHYAMWDDHDYGDNNAGRGFELKHVSYDCFKEYWGNKTYGEDNEATYSKFSYSDADFIMLDDRWFRDETDLDEKANPHKEQLGEKQRSWLFYQLSHSQAVFKFVCVGGQFLNEHTNKESFNLYKAEREKILEYIIANKISGVIFLSGDCHYTELLKYNKRESDLGYSLYELTSSAISSKPSEPNGKTPEEVDNPMRVKSSLVTQNNYCKIAITGKKGERKLQFSCFDRSNSAQWEFSITEDQLRSK